MDADLLTTLTRLISPILSNPEAMRSLSSIFGIGGDVSAEESTPTDGEESVAATPIPQGDDRSKRRKELLLALRPYLSKTKGERIEGLMRASAVLEMLEGAKKI